MTIDEMIKHHIDMAKMQESRIEKWEKNRDADAEKFHKRLAADHRQLAEWLTDYKELREENKVLTSECDRLIKEKGELLSKVSGGDVLRICQLEEQLQAELDNSHCLEIELTEAKRLLKLAVEADRERGEDENS